MKKYKYSLLLLILDLLLLNSSYFAMNYFKRGAFTVFPEYYIKLLVAFNLIWLTVSLLLKKFDPAKYKGRLLDTIRNLINTAAISCYIISFMVVVSGIFAFSRLHVFGTVLIILSAEIVIYIAYYLAYGRKIDQVTTEKRIDIFERQRISTRLLIFDFFILNFSFFIINYIKIGHFRLKPGYEILLLIIYGLWFLTSFATRKFDKDSVHDYINAYVSCLKAVILIAVILSLFVFSIRLHYYSRMQIFGTLLIFYFIEIILYGLYIGNKKEKLSEKDVESAEQLRAYFEKEQKSIKIEPIDDCITLDDPVSEKLKAALDFFNPWLFNLIYNNIDISKISKSRTSIFNSEEIVGLKILDDNALSLIINLHRLNHIRRINQYFLEIHSKLKNGGYFIGKVNTIRTYKDKVKRKYPRYFSNSLYALHFLFFRICPKLPVTKKIYFSITQGRNRIISRAEVLGRLYFCGFEIVTEKEIDYELYFIARKVKMPSTITSPSYGPIIKLRRYGMEGKPISVLKFRTMYSYSEFLQEYIHKLNNLQEGGKFNNDFRVTAWGKFMRKYWLDELPMLYNWLRGDLQLVGVRPLSFQYLSLYCNDLQSIRSRVKPGLIPPFYVDLPKTFEEICESEENYIKAYLEGPVKTQFVYFWKAINNIVIKGVRSR